MSERYSHIIRAIAELPWAIHPAAMDLMLEIVMRRASGAQLSEEEKATRVEAAKRLGPATSTPGSIAVLPLFGVIAPRIQMVEDVSTPGTVADRYGQAFTQAVNDPNIAAVVLQVDSPGGSVFGVEELGNLIYDARETKPVVAVVDTGMAASAGYWIASQASELVASPSSQVGSIGVIAAHDDISKMAELAGVKRTYITAPEGGYKAEGNGWEPLSDEARAYAQELVDAYYDSFVGAVARGRKMGEKAVRSEQFAKGRLVTARKALEAGMVDRIETLGQTISRLTARQAKAGGVRSDREFAAARLRLAGAEALTTTVGTEQT
jgi:signal peptide peptidase SppA